MSNQGGAGDVAVIAFAGRRIDAADTNPQRFPLDAVPTVRRRLADLLVKERAVAVVCSAACGGDLVVLEEAERLGLRRRIVLPFSPERFRRTSVTDHPGDWGPLFDRLIAAAQATGDLVVLSLSAGSDDTAYVRANETILREAQQMAQEYGTRRLIASVVWEGSARWENDVTAQFHDLAVRERFEPRYVISRSVVMEAKDQLKGAALAPEGAQELVKRLTKEDKFGWARRVLAKVREESVPSVTLRTWFAQQHAICTYRDPDIPVLQGLQQALAILGGSFDLKSTSDQETLGIAGAIHKRLWQVTGQKDQLERSYRYYRRGYDLGPGKDKGYTASNAAFVLDQLADIEMGDGAPSVESRRAEAREIREAVVEQLRSLRTTDPKLKTDWWYLVSVADALFGLGKYDEAERWLLDAKAVPDVPDWEFRSTATQLATLHQLQHRGTLSPDDPLVAKPARVLDAFLDSPAARESAFIGKVGLALSGGDFAHRCSISVFLQNWRSSMSCGGLRCSRAFLAALSSGRIITYSFARCWRRRSASG
jgi:hypothetical protein